MNKVDTNDNYFHIQMYLYDNKKVETPYELFIGSITLYWVYLSDWSLNSL